MPSSDLPLVNMRDHGIGRFHAGATALRRTADHRSGGGLTRREPLRRVLRERAATRDAAVDRHDLAALAGEPLPRAAAGRGIDAGQRLGRVDLAGGARVADELLQLGYESGRVVPAGLDQLVERA